MVSSGQVNSDLGSLSSKFSSYSSSVSELDGSWNGSSHDVLVADANEFSTSFLDTVKSQMNSFGEACDLYKQYKDTKDNLEVAKTNYNRAVSNKDTRSASTFSSQISTYNNTLSNLKEKINSLLRSASATKLQATPVQISTSSATESSGGASSSNARIQSAMDWAIAVAADDTHGYSQNTRYGNPNYDCSSFVISAYEAAGIPVKEAGAGYTGNMRSAFTKVGFKWIPGNPSVSDLQPGDVLLREHSHTEMYIGNGLNVAAHGDYDGRNGDSTGKEICVSKYYGPWEGVLRYVGNTEGV